MNWIEIKQKIQYGDKRQVSDILNLPSATVYSVINREAGIYEPVIKNALMAIICNREALGKRISNLITTRDDYEKTFQESNKSITQ